MLLVLSILITAGVLYLLNKYLLSYWSRLGFKQLEPRAFYGNAAEIFRQKKSLGQFFAGVYENFKEHKMVGIYFAYRPILMVTDAKLVQDILIRDFTAFHDRPFIGDEVKDPLSAHLFNLAGQQWRDMRAKLSPTFTSGKLRGMFSTIRDCSKVLEDYLMKNLNEGTNVFEFRDLMARFNTNVISSVAFGIESDCINEPDHIFRKMGAKAFTPSTRSKLRSIIGLFAPKLRRFVNLKATDDDVEEFIFSIVKQTIAHRESQNLTRNDFMQLLLQLKDQGYVPADKGEKKSEDEKSKDAIKLTINQLAAQAFVFFIAGFETSSSTMSFCLFELARNPKIQRKVQEEVDRVFKTQGISYESLAELKYLECCIDETLRKYPIAPVLVREATRDYKVADSDLVIPKGTSIFIPTLGFHRDLEIYENPMQFKPKRFVDSPTGNGNAKGVFYTPFGDGPRSCIGIRMGKLTTKIGLAMVLSKFNLQLTDNDMADKELEFHPKQYVLTPTKPFNFKVVTR